MAASMSFRERHARIALSTYVVVFGVYFWTLAEKWGERAADAAGAMTSLLGLAALILVFLALKLGAAFEAPRKQAKPDEREQLIELKATRIAGIVVTAGVAAVVVGALAFGLSAFLAANLLIVALVSAQAAKAIAEIAYYKAGA